MSFLPPRGATLIQVLGAGTVMEVALVRWGTEDCICKRLRSRMRDEPVAAAALQREAGALERARHPALPTLIEVGDDLAGPYLVESCLRGASVRELVDGWRERGAPMPQNLLRHLLRESTRTVAELHGLTAQAPLELVHGDLAPDHLLLGEDGRIMVIDWGQARWRDMPSELAADDRGTLPFVAPEVARGEARPSQRTDVYSLAATLAFVALGREPCTAEPGPARLVEVAERGVDREAIEGAVGLDSGERAALLAALALDPDARVGAARELFARLAPVA